MPGLLILFAAALVLLVVIAAALLAWEMRHPPRHTAGWAIARGRPCDPADLGLEFEEWMLETPGARLPVWEIRGKRGQDSGGTTVVLIHGWGESRLDVLTRLEPWVDHASRLVLYDLRGHGDASGSASRLGDGEEDDLLQLIGALGGGEVVLVGWSMGGVIALAAAARASDDAAGRIAGVVTIGAYACFHTSLRGRLRVQNLPTRPLTDLALMVHRICGVRPRGAAAWASAAGRPALLIHGEDDAVVPAAHAQELAAMIDRSRAVIIPGGDHLEPRTADEAQFDDAATQFLHQFCSTIDQPTG